MKDQLNKEKKKKILIISTISTIITALVVVIIILVLDKNDNNNNQRPNLNKSVEGNNNILERGFVQNENDAQNVFSSMKDKVEDGMFECKMTMEWTFLNGKAESANAYVENSKNNKYTFFFDVVYEATDEIVYSSPLVPVGESIKGIKFNKDLGAGTHIMKVNYTMVDDDYNEVSSVGFKIKANILR